MILALVIRRASPGVRVKSLRMRDRARAARRADLAASAAGEPWFAYAALLCAMLCLVVSRQLLDDVRPRIVAGWLGIAGVIVRHHLGGEGLTAAPLRLPCGGRHRRCRFCNARSIACCRGAAR